MSRPRVCVLCSGQQRASKLLKCLHSLCVGCVPKQITRLNEVCCPSCKTLTPSPSSAGASPLLWLPDSFEAENSDGASSGREGSQVEERDFSGPRLCVECGEEKVAVSRCADCDALLCDIHGPAHSLSRATFKHRVCFLDASAADPNQATGWAYASETSAELQPQTTKKPCAVHPDYELQTYCTVCKDLLCEMCLKNAHDTSHSLLSVPEAAAEMRQRVESKILKNADEGESSVIGQAIAKISAAIDALHNQTEQVSEEVEENFSGVRRLVKARETQVLEALDALRSAKLVPLEEQRRRLEVCKKQQETLSSVLESCKNCCDVIRMTNWLLEAAENVNSAKNDLLPCVTSQLMFYESHQSELAACIQESGAVYDADDIDMSQSRLICPAMVSENEEMIIGLKMVFKGCEPIDSAVLQNSLNVGVAAYMKPAVKCPVSAGDDGRSFVAKFRSSVGGTYTVTARLSGRDLAGSPAVVAFGPETFDPARLGWHTSLYNNNRTAKVNTTWSHHDWRAVCGSTKYRTGRTTIRVRLDAKSENRIYICMCNSARPRLEDVSANNSMYGWCGSADNPRNLEHSGTQLGQPWEEGDVISLTLDCDQHTLTGVHERSRARQTLTGVTGELYLYIVSYELDMVFSLV